jgi:biopolymer transport protein TolR
MAMMGNSGMSGLSSEINVTPLIDVLLVLLIIFMVIVPVVPRGLNALVPQAPKDKLQPAPDTVVVEVGGGFGKTVSYRINQQVVAKKDLRDRLSAIYATRAERVMFVKGDPGLDFASIAEVIDLGHSAGVDHIGLIGSQVGTAR